MKADWGETPPPPRQNITDHLTTTTTTTTTLYSINIEIHWCGNQGFKSGRVDPKHLAILITSLFILDRKYNDYFQFEYANLNRQRLKGDKGDRHLKYECWLIFKGATITAAKLCVDNEYECEVIPVEIITLPGSRPMNQRTPPRDWSWSGIVTCEQWFF